MLPKHMRAINAIAALVIVCGLAHGQTADPALTFEVASIKPSPPPDGRPRAVRAIGVPGSPYGKDPGRFATENFSLSNLITMAYDIPYYRLSAPDLLVRSEFNVEAKMPVDTTKEQFQVMLQNLLAERFGLKVHWTSKQMDLYNLVVAKGGPKLKPAEPDPPPGDEDSRQAGPGGPPQLRADGYPIPPPGNQKWMAIMRDKAVMRGHNETTAQMASAFSSQVGGPVNDATGLTGNYDYLLYWSTSTGRSLSAAAPATSDVEGPSLFDAVQEQLGLKLEAKKGPVQVLVVDHVANSPTQN